MRIDLHTHSAASDGTDPPGELVRAAKAAGLDVVALTDHDTAAGWAEAEQVAEQVGMILVQGMEISTRHQGRDVHLLAYLLDPTHRPLAEALERVLDGRDARVPQICARLAAEGVEVTEDDVRRAAGDAVAAGRPHVADALVAAGVVDSRDEAFARYLSSGRPGYVPRYAVPLVEMVGLVRDAGGVTVVAHPWGRHDPACLDEQTLAELRDLGLAGIEVDHQDHDRSARDALRAIARNLDLVATGSSDYHGTGKVDHDLGVNTTHPDEYQRLVDRAAEAARLARRPVPVPAGPGTGG